jgi:hypothetical protein
VPFTLERRHPVGDFKVRFLALVPGILGILGGFSLPAVPEPAAAAPLMVKTRMKKGDPWKERETRTLAHLPDYKPQGPPALTPYGGWADRKADATGFFHVKKQGDRWWLVDPGGALFLHIAVNAVRPGGSDAAQAALAAKFGPPDGWVDPTAALLRGNGFNGTGAWSDDRRLAKAAKRLPYTPIWNFMSAYGKNRGGTFQQPGHTGYPKDCIFVFDPEFETFADEHAKQLDALKDDPYCVGHFSDNEMPFPKNSLDNFLSLEEKDAGRQAAVTWLSEKKGADAGKERITDADREAFRAFVADRYYAITTKAIRKHDPNHLCLGSRFYGSEKGSAAVFQAAGRHLDVISVNVYGVWTPTAKGIGDWAAWSGRPVLVTEWYAKGDDSGMANTTGAGWTVPTQKDRGHFYQNFTLGLLESKACVGWHWFKHQDNDPADLKTDPSNRDSNKGIVTVAYEPYAPLLDAMRELNAEAYRLTAYFDRPR